LRKEIITITLRWPNKSTGHDVMQIINNLNFFLRNYQNKQIFDNGSGRSTKIERKPKFPGQTKSKKKIKFPCSLVI